ncbi:hypothetical protein AVEN_272987-2 [Araneus ventricosus]|uniref:Uncharacterized protein n=2 Tax=Araneus ventricosus TaxID=182803 RepID=A0A4Y2TMC8_ARAVE|nr:hypothetical protein AVEN_272987-2 [Araneus ventricosus]
MLKETIIEFMKSVDLQPLQYLAAVRVAISVCESEDVQYMIGRFHKTNGNNGNVGFLDGQWRRVRGKVKRKLNQIGLPDLIIDIVLENLWPISFEISKWIIYHVEDTGIDCSSNFCWTPQAKIDYVKTAEILIKNEALDIKKRFKLACFYCLDSEVRSLWEQMGLSEKRSFFVRGNLKKSNQSPIVLYWTYFIQEVPIDYWGSKAMNHTQLFKYAVENGYLSATKFFLGKLKVSLRNRMISNCFCIHLHKLYNPKYIAKDHLTIACFLICQLPSNYQGMTHFNRLSLIFRYFLEWPMQKQFMTVVNRLRHYLRERTFGELLEGIFEKDIGGFKDHDYKELFMEFWHQIPEKYKIYVRTESRVGYKIFMKFVKEHFGFVFEENSFAIKAKFRAIVFQQEISENVTYFEKENVDFFKFLVRERVTTKSSIDRFSYRPFMNFPFQEYGTQFFNLPLGELMYLIDGILEIV